MTKDFRKQWRFLWFFVANHFHLFKLIRIHGLNAWEWRIHLKLKHWNYENVHLKVRFWFLLTMFFLVFIGHCEIISFTYSQGETCIMFSFDTFIFGLNSTSTFHFQPFNRWFRRFDESRNEFFMMKRMSKKFNYKDYYFLVQLTLTN